MIAWFTGLRQKDVFTLRWDCIEGDVLTTIPAKTSRFGRGVRIPIHPQLAEELSRIPRVNERVLGAWYYGTSTEFQAAFVKLLKSLGIEDDERGIVNFNCFRDSFITRCDAEGVPRHATRGVVGHVSDRQTDLYSHDLTSARRIQELPWVKLE
jgi:integrase